jgi:integrase
MYRTGAYTVSKAPTNLWLRYRTWFLRLSIPPSLRQHFGGKDKIVESLQTADLDAAIAERDRRVAEYQQQFDQLRASSDTAVKVSAGVRQPSAARKNYFAFSVSAFYETYVLMREVGTELEEIRKILGKSPEEFRPASKLWTECGREALQKKIAPHVDSWADVDPKTLIAFLTQPPTATAATDTPPTAVAAPAIAAPVPNAKHASLTHSNGGERFSEALAAHLKSIKSSNPTTHAEYKRMAQVFEDYCKDAPIISISRKVAADFLDKHLLEERKIAKRTRNLYASLLQSIFKTAIRRGRFDAANPFEGQKLDVDEEHYNPFTDEEIPKLFAGLEFDVRPKQHTVQTALPWAMLIGAYAGARREEICQLRKEDFQERDGVTFFDIHNGNGNSLKNKSAPRCIPVHSQLIKRGLLDYVAALPNGSRLFPALKPRKSRNNKVGAELGDEFREWRRSVGVDRDGVNFHSFRHSVANMLDKLGVPETDSARVLGHKIDGITYSVYSHDGPGLKRLQKIVEQIKHPGLVQKVRHA